MKNILKRVLLFIVVLLVIGILGAAGLFFWYQNGLNYRNTDNNELTFTIKQNETLDSVMGRLQTEGFKIEKVIWQAYFKLNPGLGDGIQAGDFILSKNMSIPDVVQALQKANQNKGIKVTLTEGLRYDEQADLLDKAFVNADPSKRRFSKTEYMNIVENPNLNDFSSDVKSFLSQNKPEGKNLEGFLFPDTYYFNESTTALSVINKQITTLMMKLDAEDYQKIYDSNYSFHEYLVVASLLERETVTEAERPIVSDILYKRLEKGIDGSRALQLCSTMLYIIKDWKADYKINEALKNKYKDNPYNTYRVEGLPPGPIANPGISTLKAAIYPEANEYYYFLHDKNGIIHYAKTYAEHNANIRKFL